MDLDTLHCGGLDPSAWGGWGGGWAFLEVDNLHFREGEHDFNLHMS